MRGLLKFGVSLLVTISATEISVFAQSAVQWRIEDGGNGHWYENVQHGSVLSWQAARLAAEARGGYLACPTTQIENNWVWDRVVQPTATGWDGWIGLFQDPSSPSFSEPSGGWKWVSGEAATYFAWCGFQPDNSLGPENFCNYHGNPRCWNDMQSNGCYNGTCLVRSYVVEYSADCNNDGIVDYGQCRNGSLPDFNGNNIPDCCESGTPCTVGNYPVQWRVADGGNGHWYRYCSRTTTTTLQELISPPFAPGSTATTIGSTAEETFLQRVLIGANITAGWLGFVRPGLGSFAWVTGESVAVTNWGGANCGAGPYPNDTGFPGPTAVKLIQRPDCGWVWDDIPLTWEPNGVLVEWSADCNNDGVVDYGQILTGVLADTDSNGIPDACLNAVTVPTQYPTIQAAIDATPAGTARTINVLAGTYNQAFSLNGKNVVVRGAAGNTTILNGTGLTTSIATFTGGEPATAGVENLVFRNGIVGRPINPPSYNFTGGGGVFGKDSSAFIRNCRFEDCGADFGAGIYMLRCTVDVDGCVFSSNDATTDGGGMQTYACSGVVKNSTFTGNRCALSYAGSGSAFKGVGIRTAGTTLALQACTISGNPIPNAGAAVEYFENVKVLPGVLRLVDTDIVSNTVGSGSIDDAGALRILGRQQSCILSAGTTICTNSPRNVVGPYLVEGAATVCDCEADFSGNGQVDAADLGILLSVWGTSPANGQGDLNHDGIVSAPDLSALLARWGPCS